MIPDAMPANDPPITTLRTPRLLLRPWRDDDLPAFAAMNADPQVMEHFPHVLGREESDRVAARVRTAMTERGYGAWAAELPGEAPFIGFVGFLVPSFQAHFTPCVEIGWRLARAHWGHGYATEGARAALAAGFARLGFEEVVSMTVVANQRSRRVMEKLGMTRDPADDFDHPSLPAGHPLRPHVLYRVKRTTSVAPHDPS